MLCHHLDGLGADLEGTGEPGQGPMLFIAQTSNFVVLGGGEGSGPASDVATLAGSLKLFPRALRYPLALELRDRGKDMKHKPACRGRRVDILGQGSETDTARANGFDDVETVAQRLGKAIILGDDRHIGLAELVDHLTELRALALQPGDLVGINTLGPCALKGVDLGFKLLVVCTGAGLSDDHASMTSSMARQFCRPPRIRTIRISSSSMQ